MIDKCEAALRKNMRLFFHRCRNFPLFEQLRKKGEIGMAYTIKTADGRERPRGAGEAVHCGVSQKAA
jgi:hypothetical protein